ncbi:hypothetical protein DFQ27_007286 [Actinomortierella ambigua]|uniref:CipC-like antibiotic response protein n=1 Tax=Actinomortierella ambigua TaxID=1343610 RepID=A0A9P6U090_9FUNG|nr:hypothetical protein DFQ26_004373 [Actinomortierella ambigua]KAG0253658.1 hypothetical protein DFQ27_007286 [Actinomortierella ambigua]
MFGFGRHEEAYAKVYGGGEHHSSWTHELIAGAAAFEAMKKYENDRGGDHKLTKEIFAGMAGAEADKLFETRGLDALDREEARRQAERQAAEIYDQKYSN